MTRNVDGSIDFPDGTILVKTFYYYHDERDTNLGKRVIETRLLVKEDETWNVATYLWNEEQTEGILTLAGFETQVTWTDEDGNVISTMYDGPDEDECITCHQSSLVMTPLGTQLRNLNRTVSRNGMPVNQVSHLQSLGILSDFQVNQVPRIEDYNDISVSLHIWI